MKEVLKHQSNAVQVINSIKLTAIFCTTDYAIYLYEEKKKYGDAGIKVLSHVLKNGKITDNMGKIV